jgi:flavorubredoxin
MDVRTDEIADKIYRVSVVRASGRGRQRFSYNHFVIDGDEPMLFHCGLRKMFPVVSAAFGKIVPHEGLRWIGFGHFEADECGSMNEWLAAAPRAELMHGTLGCRLSVADMADRPPRVLADQEVIDIGGKYTSLGPTTAPDVRKLADLNPKLLATMHGSSFRGDGAVALRDPRELL